MAVAFDATSHSSTASDTSTLSWAHTCTGSDRLLVVIVTLANTSARTVSSVTYNGVGLTFSHGVSAGDVANLRSELWYVIAPATGSNTIAITASGDCEVLAGGGVSVTGAHQVTPLADTDSGSSTGATSASLTLTSAADGLVVDGLCSYANANFTVGADQTERWNAESGVSPGEGFTIDYAGSTEPGAASVTMSWTLANNRPYAHVAAAIAAAIDTYEQTHFRFRNDDGSETTATWLAAEDTTISRNTGQAARLRIQVDTASADPASEGMKLQYRKSGATDWIDVS